MRLGALLLLLVGAGVGANRSSYTQRSRVRTLPRPPRRPGTTPPTLAPGAARNATGLRKCRHAEGDRGLPGSPVNLRQAWGCRGQAVTAPGRARTRFGVTSRIGL